MIINHFIPFRIFLIIFTIYTLPTYGQFDSFSPAPSDNADFVDWNKPWRYKYLNSSNLTADWTVSCSGFRPVCRNQDLIDGKNIAEMSENTARPTKVTAENNSTKQTLGEINYFCQENRLEKPTVYLSAGGSWESTYIVWIASILIQELLQIPVAIRENMNADHSFYLRREPKTQKVLKRGEDSLNLIDQSR